MPGDRSHKISDHDALPASGSLSEAQFGQLLALLDDQHQALVTLLAPIHAIAVTLLADRDKPDPAAAGDASRSASEQSSG